MARPAAIRAAEEFGVPADYVEQEMQAIGGDPRDGDIARGINADPWTEDGRARIGAARLAIDANGGMTPFWSPASPMAQRADMFLGTDAPPAPAPLPPPAPMPTPYPAPAPMPMPEPPMPPMQAEAEAAMPDSGGGGWFSGPAPVYGDGSTHPAWGGQPRTQQGPSDGGGPAQQVTVPSTGASAGPGGVRAPRDSGGPPGGGGYSGGGSSGGGGGGGGDLYNALKARLTGNLFGTGSAAEETGPSEAQYRRGEKRARQDWRDWNRMQEQRSALRGADPLSMIPTLMQGQYVSPTTQSMFESLPMQQLAMLTLGQNREDRYLGNTDRYRQDLASLYQDLANGAWDRQGAINALFDPSKKTMLGQSFMYQETPEAKYNKQGLYQGMRGGNWEYQSADNQVNNFIGLLGAAVGTGRSGEHQSTVEGAWRRMLMPYLDQNMAKRNVKSLQQFIQKPPKTNNPLLG